MKFNFVRFCSILIIVGLGANCFYSFANTNKQIDPVEVTTEEWTGNSHNRESFLVATPFNMTIDGEELHLWYDQNKMVYYNEECTEPFLAPSGNPYLYVNLDGVIGFAEFYNEEDLK